MSRLELMEKHGEQIARACLAVEIRVVAADGCHVFRFDPVTFRRLP